MASALQQALAKDSRLQVSKHCLFLRERPDRDRFWLVPFSFLLFFPTQRENKLGAITPFEQFKEIFNHGALYVGLVCYTAVGAAVSLCASLRDVRGRKKAPGN